jgi:uncharacterized membrane protein YvbJ
MPDSDNVPEEDSKQLSENDDKKPGNLKMYIIIAIILVVIMFVIYFVKTGSKQPSKFSKTNHKNDGTEKSDMKLSTNDPEIDGLVSLINNYNIV